MLSGALSALADLRQFVSVAVRNGKKLPVDHIGNAIDAHNSVNWLSYAEATAIGNQVGFVLGDFDSYFLIDIDDCVNDHEILPEAKEIANQFAGAAIHLSTSGKGLHIMGKTQEIAHTCKFVDKVTGLRLELYSRKRVVVIGSHKVIGNVNFDCTVQLRRLVEKFFLPHVLPSPENFTPSTHEAVLLSDDDLIQKALNSSSIINTVTGKATFKDLWEANVAKLSITYPPQKVSDSQSAYDASQADYALALHLAFWTRKDLNRIRSLMFKSALARRKWESHKTYLQTTILKACQQQENILHKRVDAPQESQEVKSNEVFLGGESQARLFKDHTYIQSLHKILLPNGEYVNEGRFDARYGAYQFIMTVDGSKLEKSAWAAFHKSQVCENVKVDIAAFEPLRPPFDIWIENGKKVVNTYLPVETPCSEGDSTPFINLLEKMYPDTNDCLILTSYLAAMVQHKGVKFKWCVLMQGVEGNGKSTIADILCNVIGVDLSYPLRMESLLKSFNSTIARKLLIVINEFEIPKNDKGNIWNKVKSLISDERQEFEGKGVDAYQGQLHANFILTTNERSAVPKTLNERRICVLFSAQQHKAHLEISGLTNDFFISLREWLQHGGYATVHHYLKNFKIPPHLNPATRCIYAPVTSSTAEAVYHTLNEQEALLMECIDGKALGFRGDMISTRMAMNALEHAGFRVFARTLSTYLSHLGYSKVGMTTRKVMPDNDQTILYVNINSKSVANLEDITLLSDRYERHNEAS